MSKYIDADKLVAEIEKRIDWLNTATSDFGEGRRAELRSLYDFITFLQQEQPSLPPNLDEAAEKFARLYDNGTCDGIAQDCFKAGAKWMAEQGETKEGIVVDNNDFVDFEDNSFIDVCPTLDKKSFTLHDGEEVIVQIRKKK